MNSNGKYQRRRKRSAFPIIFGIAIAVCGVYSVGKIFQAAAAVSAAPPTSEAASPSGPLDREAPVITGVRDHLIYQGEDLLLTDGVAVTDNLDPAPRWEVDDSGADLNTPGTYEVRYIAQDASGNRAAETAEITVLPWKEGYATMEEIDDMADTILSEILEPAMNDRQRVTAIYDWARTRIAYTGHADKEDYRQAAWLGMTDRAGDCFTYFSVCKLFFEHLGIPNIDVEKVPQSEEDSLHYWSLVSVDGGESYYHFDATPRIGEGDDFCLVTDAFLDAYSEKHRGSHNRDTSLYPATPEN